MVFTHSEMFYKPFVFRNSNNKVINNCPGSGNLAFIEKVFEENGYSDIFLAGRVGMKLEGESEKVILKKTAVIDGDSGDLYDRLKLMIGIPSCPVVYVYHFIYKRGPNFK